MILSRIYYFYLILFFALSVLTSIKVKADVFIFEKKFTLDSIGKYKNCSISHLDSNSFQYVCLSCWGKGDTVPSFSVQKRKDYDENNYFYFEEFGAVYAKDLLPPHTILTYGKKDTVLMNIDFLSFLTKEIDFFKRYINQSFKLSTYSYKNGKYSMMPGIGTSKSDKKNSFQTQKSIAPLDINIQKKISIGITYTLRQEGDGYIHLRMVIYTGQDMIDNF